MPYQKPLDRRFGLQAQEERQHIPQTMNRNETVPGQPWRERATNGGLKKKKTPFTTR
jgi:hypothetical protein